MLRIEPDLAEPGDRYDSGAAAYERLVHTRADDQLAARIAAEHPNDAGGGQLQTAGRMADVARG